MGPPFIAVAYSTGVRLGGMWPTLPFFVATIAYILTGGGKWFLNAPGSK